MMNSTQDPAGRRPSTIQRQIVRDASGNVHTLHRKEMMHITPFCKELKNNLTLMCLLMTCVHWMNGHPMLAATVHNYRMVPTKRIDKENSNPNLQNTLLQRSSPNKTPSARPSVISSNALIQIFECLKQRIQRTSGTGF